MTDYTKLTKQEINSKVADLRGLVIEYLTNKTIFVRCDNEEDSQFRPYNPCNNPVDWAPLLEELRQLGEVSIHTHAVHLKNNDYLGRNVVEEPNLGKAICILWLMVKEVGNEVHHLADDVMEELTKLDQELGLYD